MVTVEPADVGDAAAVADLWVDLAAGQRRYGSHLLADENREAVREALARRAVRDELVIAHDGDDLVGFVSFGIETGSYEQDATRGVVQNLYVVPDRRREGVGSDLLEAAECALVAAGAGALALEAMAENGDAERFYRGHGYRPHRVELEKPVESDTLTKE